MEDEQGFFTSYGYLSLSGDEWQHEHVTDRPHQEAEKKPSIRERLAAAKQECAKQQPRPAPEKKPPELGER